MSDTKKLVVITIIVLILVVALFVGSKTGNIPLSETGNARYRLVPSETPSQSPSITPSPTPEVPETEVF